MTVPLPDVSDLRSRGEGLIAELANVNVITSNCPGYAVTGWEWTLITGPATGWRRGWAWMRRPMTKTYSPGLEAWTIRRLRPRGPPPARLKRLEGVGGTHAADAITVTAAGAATLPVPACP